MTLYLIFVFALAYATKPPAHDPIEDECPWDVVAEGKYELSDQDMERLIEEDSILTASEQLYLTLRASGVSDQAIRTFWATRQFEAISSIGNRTVSSAPPA